MSAIRLFRTCLALLLVAPAFPAPTHCQETSAGNQKRFDYSAEPGHALLYVAVTAPSTATTRSMTLYGDGRIELRKSRVQRVEESRELHVDAVEIERLMRLAAIHDLVEWDDTAMSAQLASILGPGSLRTADAPFVRVMISLTSYERGDYRREDFTTEILFQGVNTTRSLLPDSMQLAGLAKLVESLNATWREAEGGSSD